MSCIDPVSLLNASLSLNPPLARLACGRWPTPTRRLDRLGRMLGSEVWIKQDNLSRSDYGGNKVRKLEMLLAEAQQRNARSLVTVGGIGSHQILATAIMGSNLGLRTHALVFHQPVTDYVENNIRLASSLGVELVPLLDNSRIIEGLEQFHTVEPTYIIPTGGSSPVGNLGMMAAAFELRHQIEGGVLPKPDVVIIPVGTGGTLAGLELGFHLAGLDIALIGVAIAAEKDGSEDVIRGHVSAMVRQLNRRGAGIKSVELERSDLRRAPGLYGEATDEAKQGVKIAMEQEGISLETTYSGKAFAFLNEYARKEGKGKRILFWNTCNGRDTTSLLTGATLPLPAQIEEWLNAR